MASGGSSKRSISESRSFDFGSDDILCAYGDYASQQDQPSNGKRLDVSTKDPHDRVGRALDNYYGLPEGLPREDVISVVEKCMKKYADNLMRQMEGISGRLTQLELCFYKLERSVSEFQADMIHGQSEAEAKLKSLEKHVHEVHRSIQIVRDKQELAETQKELNKLHLSQNESISSPPKKNDQDVSATPPETKTQSNYTEIPNQQLALVPHQITSSNSQPRTPDQNQSYKELPLQQPAPPSLDVRPQVSYTLNQPSTYYTQHPPPPQEQRSQPQHYAPQRPQTPQTQNLSLPMQSPPPPPAGANNANPQQQFSPYQPQWHQPLQSQHPSPQLPHPRLQTPPTYPPYATYQPTNPIPETFQGTQYPPLQPTGYGDPGSSISQPPQYNNIQRQPLPPAMPSRANSGHTELNPYQQQHSMPGYNAVFGPDGGRAAHPHIYQPQVSIPSSSIGRNHPFGEMIEKAVNMGYPREQVVGVVQRIGEAGQPFDFNALLDGLNAHANGGPQAWSR
ncbi:hypothetical protein HPP92_021006 [Vanilla planifolia]|uniref:DUF1421 domain-containing protein n=1 Tax=Vanilla planifolia TaxID=51239 RepID=A0A835PY40_VANPL|nr:hypothetical protein HPP92_021006 [Vanilla planifolia]